MYLVVGLGNPGPNYAKTRHNIGKNVVASLGDALGTWAKHKSGALLCETRLGVGVGGARLILAQLPSFMNLSGQVVAPLMKFYSLEPAQLLVVHDELDLPFGVMRLKQGGGEGGHNGLKSVSASIGSKDYVRLRLGVGRPPGRMDAADFVLQRFAAGEAAELPRLIDDAGEVVKEVAELGLGAAQMRLHTAQ